MAILGNSLVGYGRKSYGSYTMVTEYSSLLGRPDLPHQKVVGLAFAYLILLHPQFSTASNLIETLPGTVPGSVTSKELFVWAWQTQA